MTVSPDGFLWLGTAAGLVRFDGAEFAVFHATNTPALSDPRILSLHVDRRGTLWAGTADGRLLQWQQGRWSRIQLQGERATLGRSVLSVSDDSEGALWLGTDGAGLLRVGTNGSVEAYGTQHGLPSASVTQVMVDTEGRCWVVSDGRLGQWHQGRWHEVPSPGQPQQPIRCIAPSCEAGLWVATLAPHPWGSRGTRLYHWRAGHWSEPLTPYPWPQDSTRSRAQAILEDQQGRIWCATAGGGVFVYEPDEGWTEVSSSVAPAQLQVLCLAEDDHGTLWIGTRTLGLLQVRPRLVSTYPLPGVLRPHVFLSVCMDGAGRIWGGTDGSGLFLWDGSGWQSAGSEASLAGQHICVLLMDRENRLWAGTFNGLYRYQNGVWEALDDPPLVRQTTTALYEDREGRIWAGTHGGLICLEGSQSRIYSSEAGLPLAPARALTEDAEGRIWVAVPAEGLFRQQGETFEPVGPPGHPALRTIRSMKFDAHQRLWFTTLGYGLGCWMGDEVRTWTTSDGLPSDHLLALLSWKEHLWISSENGIFAVQPDELLASRVDSSRRIRIVRLGAREGLPFKVCTGIGQPSASRGPDGSLLFPNGAAIVRFRPERLFTRTVLRPPQIYGVSVDGLRRAVSPEQPVKVPSGAVSYEFHYGSPHLLAPEQIRYRYQLEGLDRQSTDAGQRRTAFYNRIPPGVYRFRVWAAGGEDDWSETPTPLLLEVVPRWWERRSIQVALVVAVTALVTLGVWRWERQRSRRRMEQLRWQRAMDLERQRIARDIHDDLGSGLTEIILLSDTLREESHGLPQIRRWAEDIAACARRLTRAMDEVVWANNPRHDSLESFLTYLNRFAQELLNRAGIRCRWDVPLEVPSLPLSAETRHHLYLACKEALHNVIKHAGASEVWIRFRQNHSSFELTIEDDGRGFDLADLASPGNGLRHMQQRLTDIGGVCRIDSQPGQGTRVMFTIVTRMTETLRKHDHQN
ncbi:MAG: two-component regulator propeller domain-containing protein [Verrucomicrobiota bacterium]|nr:ATP-binding protein [Limisphaera sp.]MDW8381059.1 two-component regulator propeller domain-containing protein [Verrucomicrobiota bacterium]